MPTDKPRHPGHPPRLRLHREESDPSGGAEAVTYKFPATGVRGGRFAGGAGRPSSGARRSLVAASVKSAPVEESFQGSACGVLNGGDDPDCIGRIIHSGDLVREIERTLDRMQDRLSDFREQIDLAFRFPTPPPDDDLPPAA